MAGFWIGQTNMSQEMQRESSQSADDQHQRNMGSWGKSSASATPSKADDEDYVKRREARYQANLKRNAAATPTPTPSIRHRLMNYFHEDDGK